IYHFTQMSEGLRTILVAAVAFGAGFSIQSFRTASIPISSPERLVAELRLAQVAALLLTLTAGAYLGLAAAHETRTGVGVDIAHRPGVLPDGIAPQWYTVGSAT